MTIEVFLASMAAVGLAAMLIYVLTRAPDGTEARNSSVRSDRDAKPAVRRQD